MASEPCQPERGWHTLPHANAIYCLCGMDHSTATIRQTQYLEMTSRIAALEAENKALREALGWYASEKNYDVDDYDHEDVPGAMVNEDIRCSRCRLLGCGSYFEPDRGKRARAALAASSGGAG